MLKQPPKTIRPKMWSPPASQGNYKTWQSTPPTRSVHLAASAPALALLVPTAEVLAVGHVAQLLLAQGGSLLLSGERGVGKSLQVMIPPQPPLPHHPAPLAHRSPHVKLNLTTGSLLLCSCCTRSTAASTRRSSREIASSPRRCG